jgi:CPA1 family monovalent cation:H+ antiporter
VHELRILVALLAALALSSAVAKPLRAPQPVVLALLGLALAFVPGLPRTPVDPDLILVGFLPPILYADAFHTSWVDFRRWLRPILMLAVVMVAVTIVSVGVVAKLMIPDLPWAVCFLLGAIVSPTDTVAVHAVIEKLRVPRRVTAILGGESLVNDATGLVGVQFALAVILSGSFEAGEVATSFLWVTGGGVACGIVVGFVFARLNRIARDTRILFVLSLLSPYLAYLVAYALATSGVLAVVVAGFLVSWQINRIPPQARVDLFATWDLVIWVLNGLCFLLVGLEAPRLLQDAAGGGTDLLIAALAVSAAAVLSRIIWIFPGAYLPLFFAPRQRQREGGYPPVRGVLLASWCGVRGAVSLGAALSVPAVLADGTTFPGRRELMACALGVILFTLIVQGWTLEPLVRRLGIRADADSDREVRAAREALLAAGIKRLDEFCSEHSCPVAVHHWRSLMADELATLRDEDQEERQQARTRLEVNHEVRRAVAEEQARELLALRDGGRINDLTYLGLQLELDRQLRGVL